MLINLEKTGRVIARSIDTKRYVKKGQENFFDLYQQKRTYALEKKEILKKYVAFLKEFSSLQYVGISGSLASMNTEQEDDIDLFIITEHSQLWTGRMIAGIVALVMGIKRKRGTKNQKDKICLNLFFDRSELAIPLKKHTEYVAHEVLQLVQVINKSNTYESFLQANRWVTKIFPNAHIPSKPIEHVSKKTSLLSIYIEFICKHIQLTYMKSARTKERITENQLWFFPRDYENRVKKHMK